MYLTAPPWIKRKTHPELFLANLCLVDAWEMMYPLPHLPRILSNERKEVIRRAAAAALATAATPERLNDQ